MIDRFLGYLMWPVFWLMFPLRLRASLVLIVGDELLVVKHRIYFGQWNLPGGGVKLGEDPAQAAAREIAEELGIDVALKDLSALSESFDITREYGITSRHKFFLYKLSEKPTIKPNREILEYAWLAVDSGELGADARKAVTKL